MIAVAAFYFGWALGARGGQQSLDDVTTALNSLRQSEEFGALASALRAHLGTTLAQAGQWLQSAERPGAGGSDVLTRVRELVTPGTDDGPPAPRSAAS